MLKLSNLDKLYWKKEKITKGDLLKYYATIAPYILPYLKNRPVVLHRFPEGTKGINFFQKDSGSHVPPFIKTTWVQHEERKITYFMIQNKKSLLYVVNLGSIELHPFHARTKNLNRPDYCVFDLDPTQTSFNAVVDTALAIHRVLDKLKIPNFCKTSGGSGLHVCVPLKGKYDYAEVKQFALKIAKQVHAELPTITTLERSPQKRRKKVYIDIQQNQKMQTIVCPYSVRPFPKAPVSTPLEWKEVKHGLDPTAFNLRTIPKRLAQKKDPYKTILKKSALINRDKKKSL